ncbi:MAG: response regulator [bacterium]
MPIKILFVDDERNILNGIKRTFRLNKIEWEIFFAEDVNEALKIMAIEKADIVVSDLLMPKRDGLSLLKEVRNLYPSTIRIIMSGYSNEERSILSTQIAHHFFNKPYDSLEVINKIKIILKYREVLVNRSLSNLICSINALPSLPDIYLKLNHELRKEEPSIKKLEEIIAQDISFTSKLLQIVNSSFFGLPNKILRLSDAIQMLGLNTIKSLVLHHHLESIKPAYIASDYLRKILDHSLKVAQFARNLCLSKPEYKPFADEAFIAGLLHDSGKLILFSIPEFKKIIEDMDSEIDVEFEMKTFGVNHTHVGAYLFSLWGLPQEIVDFVANHHAENKDDYSTDVLFNIVWNANYLARVS